MSRLFAARSVRVAAEWFAADVHEGWRYFLRDVLAGSALVPRVVRYALYWLCGMRFGTANIAPGLNVHGPARHLRIGSGTFVNRRCSFDCTGPVSIGRRCQIGMSVLITTSHHELTDDGVAALPSPRAVTIGDDSWIGARALTLPGVTIGEGVVVAAGSVVAEDCLPFGLYAGVPARRVRDLRGGLGADLNRDLARTSGDPVRSSPQPRREP